jgi:hypothetical protein
VSAAGRWELDRDPYFLETSVPGIEIYEHKGDRVGAARARELVAQLR